MRMLVDEKSDNRNLPLTLSYRKILGGITLPYLKFVSKSVLKIHSREEMNIFDWADVISKRTRNSFIFISILIFISAFLIRLEINDQNKMVELISQTNNQKIILSDLNSRIMYLSKMISDKKGKFQIINVQTDIRERANSLKENHNKIKTITDSNLSLSYFFSNDLNSRERLLNKMDTTIHKIERTIDNLSKLPPDILFLIFNPIHGRYVNYLPNETDFKALYDYNHQVMDSSIKQNSFSSTLHFTLLFFVFFGIWLVWLMVLKPIINNLKDVLFLYDNNKKILEHQVNHDELTGLYNRKHFATVLETTTDCESDYYIYLFTFDLDKFKNINDRYGHDAGDSLLRKVSALLRNQIEEEEFQFRIGGDELVIVFFSKKDIEYVKRKAKSINIATKTPLAYDDLQINFSVSIGISQQQVRNYNQLDLMRSADHALYFVKNNGGNDYAVYSELKLSPEHDYLELEKEIFIAVEQEDFEVLYQPVVQLSTKKIVAAEALLRWKHKRLGSLKPEQWLLLAQRNDLLPKISAILIKQVGQHIERWRSQGTSPIRISINATDNIGECDTIINKLINPQRKLTQFPVFPIGVEITESIVLDRNLDEIISRINRLRDHGVNISLDDFGTGYATLSHLIKLPFDTIKIDKSFVTNMHNNIDNKTIVASIIKLSGGLGKTTICEGVECQVVSNMLQEMQCDYIQGYLYSKPISFNRISELLKSNNIFSNMEINS